MQSTWQCVRYGSIQNCFGRHPYLIYERISIEKQAHLLEATHKHFLIHSCIHVERGKWNYMCLWGVSSRNRKDNQHKNTHSSTSTSLSPRKMNRCLISSHLPPIWLLSMLYTYVHMCVSFGHMEECVCVCVCRLCSSWKQLWAKQLINQGK